MDIKEIVWHSEFGEGEYPFCPYCDEFAYEEDHCVFCQKPYKWVEGSKKTKCVEVGEYTVYQGTSNHIAIYKDGRCVYHAQCTAEKTEDELRTHVEFYKSLIRGRNNG